MNTWLVVARRSPARFFAPASIVVGLALLFVDQHWVGLWTETGGWIARSTALQLPLAAGAGAVTSAAWVSSGAPLAAASSARAWSRQRLPYVTAAVLYTFVPYAAIAVVAWAATWHTAGPGVPSLPYMAVGAGLTLAYLGFGCIAGILSPSRFFTPFAVMLVSLFSQALLTVPAGQYVQNTVRPVALAVVWVGAAILLIVAATIRPRDDRLSAWASRNTPRWRRPATVLPAVAAITVLALFAGTRPIQTPRDPDPVCAGRPELCLWPDHEPLRAPLAAATARLAQRFPPGLKMPAEFSERGLNRQPSEMQLPPMWFAYSAMASAVMQASFDYKCIPQEPAAQDEFNQHNFALILWITMTANGGPPPPEVHGGPPGIDINAVAQVVAAPRAEQEAWVRGHIAALQATPCP